MKIKSVKVVLKLEDGTEVNNIDMPWDVFGSHFSDLMQEWSDWPEEYVKALKKWQPFIPWEHPKLPKL